MGAPLILLFCLTFIMTSAILPQNFFNNAGSSSDIGKNFAMLNPWVKVKYDLGWLPVDKELIKKEQFILDVLRHVQQPLQNDVNTSVDTYAYVEGEQYYTEYTPVAEFLKTVLKGLLPRDSIYTILNEKHLEQTIGLFHLFYYPTNWTTFAQNVLWARQNINPEMFVHALTVAIAHRNDCKGLVLPAPYEVLPYKFHNVQTIRDAMNAKMQSLEKLKNTVTVMDRYTNEYEIMNEESKVAYFLEDIGLNSYYYNNYIDRPFWMNSRVYNLNNLRRGEQYLYLHQQLLARYYLERLSNHMGEINEISFTSPIETGYNPQLCYPNGIGFTVRKNYYELQTTGDKKMLDLIDDYERRIRDVIDTGYYYTRDGKMIDMKRPESVEELGNLIESNGDSINRNFFGLLTIYARIMLGGAYNKNIDDYNYIPSALEHYETALRDPVFYQLYKRLLKYYFRFKDNLDSYKSDDLLCPGLRIDDIKISKLNTYFEFFDSDITTSVNVQGLGNGDTEYNTKKSKKKLSKKKKPIKRALLSDPAWLEYVMAMKKLELDDMKNDIKTKKKEEKDKLKLEKMKAQQAFLETKYKIMMDALNKAKTITDTADNELDDDINNDNTPKFDSMYQTIIPGNDDDKNKLMLSDYELLDKYRYNTDIDSNNNNNNVDNLDYYNKLYGIDKYTPTIETNEKKTIKKRSLPEDTNFTILARQMRLNHEPFTIDIAVTSDKPQKVVVRIFLGPKYDENGNELTLKENRDNFVELNQFLYNVSPGKTIIHTDSQYFNNVRQDFTTYTDLYKQIMNGVKGQVWLSLSNKQCSFPDRLLLPMGWIDGMPMQLFVIITPYLNTLQTSSTSTPTPTPYTKFYTSSIYNNNNYNSLYDDNNGKLEDNRPLGFPFDRTINENEFLVPNIFVKEVEIFHTNIEPEEVTETKQKKKKE